MPKVKRDRDLMRRLWESGYHADVCARVYERIRGEPISPEYIRQTAANQHWQRPAHYSPKLADPFHTPSEEEIEAILRGGTAEIVPADQPKETVSIVPAGSAPMIESGMARREIEAASYMIANWIRQRVRTGQCTVAEIRALSAALRDVSTAHRPTEENGQQKRQGVVQIAIVASEPKITTQTS